MAISERLYRAVWKSLFSRYSVYAINLLTLALLARLLSPEVFGTIAAIHVFYAFFQIIAEAGLGPAIINLDSLSSNERNGIFSFTLIIGLVVSASFILLAPLLGQFYGIDQVDVIARFFAVAVFFFSLSVVPLAFLLRQQDFFSIAYSGILGELVSTAAVLVLMRYFDPVISLGLKAPVASFTAFLVVYLRSSKTDFGRPVVGKNLHAIGKILRPSSYQYGFNFVAFFCRNLDNVLVGKYMGATALGVYEKSYHLMRYPLLLISGAIQPAIQPILRLHKDDNPAAIEMIHRDFALKISVVGSLAGLLLYLLSEELVLLILGPNWEGAQAVLEILAITVGVQVVMASSGGFYQALDRMDLLLLCGCISAVFIVSSIVLGVRTGDLELLAWALVISFHLSFIQSYLIMYFFLFKKSPLMFFIRMVPMAVVALGMVIGKLVG